MSSSKQTKFSGTKAAGISILALCLLAFSQLLALLIGNMLVAGGMSAVTGNIFTGILYVGLVLGGVFLICKKMLKIPMADFKIGKPDLYPFWIIAAFAMPLLVILIYQLFAGTWQQSTLEAETLKQLVAGSVAYLGLATGIVEETVFRGIIMSSVEYAWNRKIAVIAPSVLFGCLQYSRNDPGSDSRKSRWNPVFSGDLLYRNDLVFRTHAWNLELSDDRRTDSYRICGR